MIYGLPKPNWYTIPSICLDVFNGTVEELKARFKKEPDLEPVNCIVAKKEVLAKVSTFVTNLSEELQ